MLPATQFDDVSRAEHLQRCTRSTEDGVLHWDDWDVKRRDFVEKCPKFSVTKLLEAVDLSSAMDSVKDAASSFFVARDIINIGPADPSNPMLMLLKYEDMMRAQ